MKILRNGKSVEKVAPPPSFQARVDEWLIACFGEDIARDPIERNHRFLEEALETVQSAGCTQSEAHQLVDYVYGRDVGDLKQEVGGVMVTLAALCLAHGLDMDESGETELARVWTKIEKIRAKQAAKPKHSPLPQTAEQIEPPAVDVSSEAVTLMADGWREAGVINAADMLEALVADRNRHRTFLRTARAIVQAYAYEHPTHVWQGSYQDAMGAHAWLAAEAAEVGTMRDGGDPKVERT